MEPEQHSLLFLQLVLMFHSACMQHLGKVHNPVTNKAERDLEQAKMMIDLLEMVQAKTKGNLTKEEDVYLSNALREVRLNYVDEMKKPESSGDKS